MTTEPINAADTEFIDRLVAHYVANQGLIRRFLESVHVQIADAIVDPEPLSKLVHSVKRRMKDPSHLKDKLIRKFAAAQRLGTRPDITQENLFVRINDLGGYRILHLHTRQMGELHNALLPLLDQAQCDLFEPPFANIWDCLLYTSDAADDLLCVD